MRQYFIFVLLAVWLSLALDATTAATLNTTKRATDVASDAVSVIPNGLLLENDQQTFCQVMIVSRMAGVAAASCFDYNDDGSVGPSSYTVAISGNGIDGILKLNVIGVEKHPKYNPNSFANNLAIVKLDMITAQDISYTVGDLPSEWPQHYFVHRSMFDDLSAWNDANIIEDTLADTDACGAASPLFRENESDFVCNMATRKSFTDSNCVLPYKYVVGFQDANIAQLGFYSHSAIQEDTGFCSGDTTNTIYNYYILLAHYIPWINTKVTYPLTTYHMDGTNFVKTNASYSMRTDITYTGDEPRQYSLYKVNEVIEGDPSAANDDQSTTGSSDTADDNNANVSTTTVYSTKYKTEHDGTTTVYRSSATTTSTKTTTVYNDAFTIVDTTNTETVTEAQTLTVTLSDGEICPTVSYCQTSYLGPGQVEVITSTVTVTEGGDVSGDEGESTLSSFEAVTVTVAETTLFETVTLDAVTETIIFTTTNEFSEDDLDGLDSSTDPEAPSSNEDDNNNNAQSSANGATSDGTNSDTSSVTDDPSSGFIFATDPNDLETMSNSDDSVSDDTSSSSDDELNQNDSQNQAESKPKNGLSIGAIVGIIAAAVVIAAGAGYIIFRWRKNKKSNVTPDEAPPAPQTMSYVPPIPYNPNFGSGFVPNFDNTQSAYGMPGAYNTGR